MHLDAVRLSRLPPSPSALIDIGVVSPFGPLAEKPTTSEIAGIEV
jgi:hypothetical protein